MIRPLLAILLLAPAALAAPSIEICGNGYDDLTSGNTYGSCPAGWHNAVYQGTGCDRDCLSIDKDHDGYTTDGSGLGLDCDDTDRRVFPGNYSLGTGGAGTYKICQSSGSFGSDGTLSAFSCKTGGGVDMWISPTGATTAGCGAYASPCNYTCFSNTGAGCYRSPVAGDCYIMRTGNYTTTWSAGTKQVYVNDKDGTSANPIILIGAPGETTPVIQGQGVSPTELIPFQFDNSAYWKIQNIAVSGGFSNSGIYLNGAGSSNIEVVGVQIYNVDGNRPNNVSGIKTNTGDAINIHHSLLYDNYDRDTTYAGAHNGSQENSRQITTFEGEGTKIEWNVAYLTPARTSTATGPCVTNKHGDAVGPVSIKGNIVFGCNVEGIGCASTACTIENNIIVDSDFCVNVRDFGGTPWFQNIRAQNNTCVNVLGALQYNPSNSANPVGEFYFQGNVYLDNRSTSHPTDATEGDVRVDHYAADADYTENVTGGLLNFSDNCYGESGGQTFFASIYGDNSSTSFGATYTTMAGLQGAYSGSEANSVLASPSFDYKHQSAVSGCGRGWAYNLYPSSGGASGTRRKGQLRYSGRKGQ